MIRNDLKMSSGKIAVQAAHAAVTGSELAKKNHPNWWKEWFDEGQRKIVVKIASENKLLKIEAAAKTACLPAALIQDKGLTEVPPKTITSLVIGPAPSQFIDKITGKFSLL